MPLGQVLHEVALHHRVDLHDARAEADADGLGSVPEIGNPFDYKASFQHLRPTGINETWKCQQHGFLFTQFLGALVLQDLITKITIIEPRTVWI